MSTHVEWIPATANITMLRPGDPFIGDRDDYDPEDLGDDDSVGQDHHALALSDNEVVVVEGTLDELEQFDQRVLEHVRAVRSMLDHVEPAPE